MSECKKRHVQKVYPDYDEIRKKIIRFSFREARLMRGPIYEVILQEFYESGCDTSAKHFCALVQKENAIMGTQILYRVSDNRELLLALFEHVKLADITMRREISIGKAAGFKLLYDCVILLEGHRERYDWLLHEFYEIVSRCLFKIEPDDYMVNELKARFLYKYGLYLKEKDLVAQAVSVLNESSQLCKSTNWFNKDTNETLHVAVVHAIAQVYIKLTSNYIKSDPPKALDLIRDCLAAIAEVGPNAKDKILQEAEYLKIKCLIQCQDYDKALRRISSFKIKYKSSYYCADLMEIRCKVFLQEAISHYNMFHFAKAVDGLYSAFTIALRFDFHDMQGELWNWTGKVLSLKNEYISSVRLAYMAAKQQLTKYGKNDEKVRGLDYLLANARKNEIYPCLQKNIKSRKYCSFYELRLWKNQCRPFWIDGSSNNLDINDNELKSLHPLKFLSKLEPTEVTQGIYEMNLKLQKRVVYIKETKESDKEKVKCLMIEYPTATPSPTPTVVVKRSKLDNRDKDNISN